MCFRTPQNVHRPPPGQGEQVILLLNRRGFARSIQCPDCGHVITCMHCSLPLTYHRTEDRLMCHLCGFKSLVPRTCPECKSASILLQGYGTQKVEEILRRTFPRRASCAWTQTWRGGKTPSETS
ncbi:MAG: hypothetical protein ACLSCR_03495 [Akkermansia sp.]